MSRYPVIIISILFAQAALAQNGRISPLKRMLATHHIYRINQHSEININSNNFLLCPNKGKLRIEYIWPCYPSVCPTRYSYLWPEGAVSNGQLTVLSHGDCPEYRSIDYGTLTSFEGKTLCLAGRSFKVRIFTNLEKLGRQQPIEGAQLTYSASMWYQADETSSDAVERSLTFSTRQSIKHFRSTIGTPSGQVVAHTPTMATIHFNFSSLDAGPLWQHCIIVTAPDGNYTVGCLNENTKNGYEVSVSKSILPGDSEPQDINYFIKTTDRVCEDSVDSNSTAISLEFDGVPFSKDPITTDSILDVTMAQGSNL